MKHYIKVFWLIVKINISLLLTYRANFYNAILITVGWGIVSIASVIVLTSKTSSVYGWTRSELYLLTGVYSILIGIFHIFFSSSFERFAQTVNLGQLDSYLLQPIETQFFLSIKIFRPVTTLRVIIGVLFTTYVLTTMHVSLSLPMIFFFLSLLLCGVMLLYSLWFLVITLTIWNPNLSNLVDFMYNISNVGRYPPALILYTKNIILFVLIPLTLIASVPSRFILGKVSWIEIISLFFMTGFFLVLSRVFWKFALRHYTSASS